MTESLTVLAERANRIHAKRAGFVRCHVVSEDPPILGFDFASANAAQQFVFDTEVQGGGGRMEIPEHEPTTVLQHR